MPLLSIHPDQKYRTPKFDEEQILAVFGEDIHQQFNINYNPIEYAEKWQTLDISFDDDSGLEGNLIPDISVHYGRLYLSPKAYEVLKDRLKDDGEFLPIQVDSEQAYFFNPLKKAESVNGLNEKLSIKNEWGEIENLAFYEEKVKDFAIFKSDFDQYIYAFCHDDFKAIIQQHNLKGISFSVDLGNPFGIWTIAIPYAPHQHKNDTLYHIFIGFILARYSFSPDKDYMRDETRLFCVPRAARQQ